MKTFLLATAAASAAIMCPSAWAQNAEHPDTVVGGIEYHYEDSIAITEEDSLDATRTVTVKGYVATALTQAGRRLEHVVIGPSVEGVPVEAVGDSLFMGNTSIRSLRLVGVSRVGQRSFHGCANLGSVDLGEDLLLMGVSAFEGCTGLYSVSVPRQTNVVGQGAFRGCKGVEYVYLDGPEVVQEDAFAGCENLRMVLVGPDVKGVRSQAFADCPNLRVLAFNNDCEPGLFPFAWGLATDAFTGMPDGSIVVHAPEKYRGVSGNPYVQMAEDPRYTKFAKNVVYDGTTGVEGIEADAEAPARYFTPGGVEVSADDMAPGLYIVLKGGRAAKVLVR